jgi:hypothetical protein
MIKTAPSDILRPPFGASAIQPHACREVQPTSRPVDNSPLKFHKQRGTCWRSSQRLRLRFAGPPYGATHTLSAAQCRDAPKAAIPSAKRN